MRLLASWYLVAADEQLIPPDVRRTFAERMKTTFEKIESGHVAMVSRTDAEAGRNEDPAPVDRSGGRPRSRRGKETIRSFTEGERDDYRDDGTPSDGRGEQRSGSGVSSQDVFQERYPAEDIVRRRKA